MALDSKSRIQSEADQCVKCGLCLPVCPTFSLTKSENESPRGRISLIQGLESGQLSPTSSLINHLDHCLQCRACEAVCPSEVNYGKLISKTRTSLGKQLSQAPRALRLFTHSSKDWYKGAILLWLYQKFGLQALARMVKFVGIQPWRNLDKMIPKSLPKPISRKEYYPPLTTHQTDVILFPGCINSMVDNETIDAAIKILTHFGFGVLYPKKQYCCGALAQLSNKTQLADDQFKQHQHSYHNIKANTILTMATGCLAHIKLHHADSDHLDITDFINQQQIPEDVIIAPLNKKIMVHTACTQKNALKLPKSSATLLQKIPGLQLSTPVNPPSCCGSAGDYSFKFNDTSTQLGKNYLKVLLKDKPNIICTSNIGCSLQFKTLLEQKSDSPLVFNPLVLLAKQISLNKQ